ncbi:MAG: hypothetical protein JWL72_1188 [Ilumatobacteraceae bacterium]|nr:hypothetical protein [Ilumatobacteraceae bacterium]
MMAVPLAVPIGLLTCPEMLPATRDAALTLPTTLLVLELSW